MFSIRRVANSHNISSEERSYNERLFGKGFRGYLHTARFRWLRRSLEQLKVKQGSVLELGCFDAKTIDYLPFMPSLYKGYDADMEEALPLAADRWKNFPRYSFIQSATPDTFNPQGEQFDMSIVMETFEHLPQAELPLYLSKVRAATRQYLFASIPVEKGPVAVLKSIAKKIFLRADEHYTTAELWHVLTGNMKKVERNDCGHKGFDYADFLRQLSREFDILKVEGMPIKGMAPLFNFTVGIIARPKPLQRA